MLTTVWMTKTVNEELGVHVYIDAKVYFEKWDFQILEDHFDSYQFQLPAGWWCDLLDNYEGIIVDNQGLERVHYKHESHAHMYGAEGWIRIQPSNFRQLQKNKYYANGIEEWWFPYETWALVVDKELVYNWYQLKDFLEGMGLTIKDKWCGWYVVEPPKGWTRQWSFSRKARKKDKKTNLTLTGSEMIYKDETGKIRVIESTRLPYRVPQFFPKDAPTGLLLYTK